MQHCLQPSVASVANVMQHERCIAFAGSSVPVPLGLSLPSSSRPRRQLARCWRAIGALLFSDHRLTVSALQTPRTRFSTSSLPMSPRPSQPRLSRPRRQQLALLFLLAQLCVGVGSLHCCVCGVQSESSFLKTLSDFIRYKGVMRMLHSDKAYGLHSYAVVQFVTTVSCVEPGPEFWLKSGPKLHPPSPRSHSASYFT